MHNRESVERLNAALMVVSCVVAFAAPFHLFLFAYAFLGPLHYLTEISWLHDRDYFAPRPAARRWWLSLVGIAIAVLLYGYVTSAEPTLEIGLVYLVFLTAPLLLWVHHPVNAGALVLGGIIALALFSSARAYAQLAYLMVTVIHVLVFTAAFVLYGALKSRSRSAIASLLIYAGCIAALLTLDVAPLAEASETLRGIYTFFEPLNQQLMTLLGFEPLPVMRLIAFAYMYHYLNWFSKTSIIRWHDVPRMRFATILALWVAAVAIYIHDYNTGLSVLYVLSLLHVLLEFPLNHKTFAGIGSELKAWVRA
ncbi:MAG TPA: hypothetical protein VEK11_12805 [Thermoanaerobaculia bacterium]|nr:hypothetical protein [Thermoanaerobaculia bacterium]